MTDIFKLAPIIETEEKAFKPVYIRIGRGEGAEALVLSPKIAELLCKTLLAETNRGEMATGGGTTGRTQEGNELAKEIFKLTDLLIEKAD